MIFKHLFRSKHQNPDPQVRLKAIENMNNQDPEQKSILHELAFNDSDVKVSLAALDKLDSFVLWYKMSEIAKNERVQKKSQQFVEKALLDGQSSTLEQDEKRRFMLETRDARLIEKMLTQTWVQQDPELALALLKKIDKPQLNEKILFEAQNEQLKIAILNNLTNSAQSRKVLNKLIKKSSNDKTQAFAGEMLAAWIDAEKAPIELEQQVKMLLSLLLALKDQHDLMHIKQQRDKLTNEYQQLTENFGCLAEQKRDEIKTKFADISARVEHTISVLTPIWQEQQAQNALTQEFDELKQTIQSYLRDLTEQFSQRISQISPTEVESLSTNANQLLSQVHKLTNKLTASKATQHKELEQLNNQLVSSNTTLASLPKLQAAIEDGQALVTQLEKLSLPCDVSQLEAADEYLKEQKQTWRVTLGQFQAHLPAELTKQWRQNIELWQQAIKKLKKQIEQDVARCRNKMRAVDSLVQQGKFKAAMGLYQKVSAWYFELPSKQQGQLERSFTAVKEQIENLQDWQEYIAAPRKPALLVQVQALIDKPLAIEAQAAAIKALRSQWNSLGKIATESDQALNAAFEVEIEKAFAPCREHYDQQQQKREQNLQLKQAILAELGTLAQQDVEIPKLARSVKSLQQKWRNIGEVDFKLRNDLYQNYQQLLAPLKAKIDTFYAENAEQKRLLISKVEKLVEHEPVHEAIEQAKVLQEKWKSIEHAGAKTEKQLWAAFKQANDNLFAKRNEINQQQKDHIISQVQEINAKLEALQQALDSATDKASINAALQDKEQVLDSIATLPKSEHAKLQASFKALQNQQKNKLTALKKTAQTEQLETLFASLKSWQQSEQPPATVQQLNKQWQTCFNERSTEVDRHALTIKMEIVGQKDSPKKDSELRQNIQMQMMAKKLQSGDEVGLTTLLKEWISGGALNKADLALLKRITPLFLG